MKHGRITIAGRMASILYNTVCTMDAIGIERRLVDWYCNIYTALLLYEHVACSVVIVTNHRNSFLCQQVIILTIMALGPRNVQFKVCYRYGALPPFVLPFV